MKFLKEPLVHFLLLGAGIFGVHAWRQGDTDSEAEDKGKRIEINAAVITRLTDAWTRQFLRPPSAADLSGQVDAHIKEEVLCREALAMGLDRDDSIVRRRLAQKLEFLTQDISMAAPPDEEALARFFTQHAARYSRPAEVGFRHVFFSRERRGPTVEDQAREALAALTKSGVSEETLGDPFLHDFTFAGQREQDVSGLFGPEFARTVMSAPLGTWTGPVSSSYGLHLLLVTEHAGPQPEPLARVRDTVMRDLLDERRRQANGEVIAGLRKNYEIVIDGAAMAAAASAPVATTRKNP